MECNKRKDFTPKKEEGLVSKKRSVEDVIVLSDDDEPKESGSTSNTHVRSLKSEFNAVDVPDDTMEYYRGNVKLPILHRKSPEIQEIATLCIFGADEGKLALQKPLRIKETATFVVNQETIGLRHPYDLDADDTAGAFLKKDSVRFYEIVENQDSQTLEMSSEVHVSRDSEGKVVSGTYNTRTSKGWKAKNADMQNVCAAIRRRAVHKKTQAEGGSFTRVIMFLMPLSEYNLVYGKLKDLPTFKLTNPFIVVHYSVSAGTQSDNIKGDSHGNAKAGSTATEFRPREHSFKVECRTKAAEDTRAPRIIAQESSEKNDLLDSETDSSSIRDPKQITNYRYNYGEPRGKRGDDLKDVILQLLNQSTEASPNILDKSQPFIQEFTLRSGNQPSIVAYLNQTLKDLERFCTMQHLRPSPLVVDTTFNISEFYFTQTGYMNLSLVSKKSGKHPWFPGPLLVHRSKTEGEFQYFWQTVKRGSLNLERLSILGTDEEAAVYNGILSETLGKVHLLGQEHVKANIERKLDELKFPSNQKQRIISDVFGGPKCTPDSCLCDCENEQQFVQKVAQLKEQWDEIERTTTRNDPPKFTQYFERHKEEKIRCHVAKYVRNKAGIQGVYGQNPIEWLHFMSKSEINEAVKNTGVTHREAPLTAALDALKGRNIRLYSDACKAVYGEGPYSLSPQFSKFQMSYDEWKDLPREERSEHLKKFLTASPRVDSGCHGVSRAHSSPKTTPEDIKMMEEYPGEPEPQNRAAASTHTHKKLSIQAEEAAIPEESVRLTTLQDIFRKAECLFNEPNAIMGAASNDPRMRTVKSRSGGIPLIVQSVNSKSNLLSCQCSTYNGLGLCADTVAVAEKQGILFEYLADLRMKLSRKRGKKNSQGDINLTAAIETGLKLSEKGLKPGEAQKTRRRTQKSKESHAANTSSTTIPSSVAPSGVTHDSQTPITAIPPSIGQTTASNNLSMFQGVYQMNPGSMGEPHHVWNTTQAQVPMRATAPPLSYQTQYYPMTPQWNSGFSPYPYTLCQLPAAVKKCYGCGEEFSPNYRVPPNNIIVKHVDRRLRGRDDKGQIVYSPDFTNTYYHPITSHIARKNPFFGGSVKVERAVYEGLTYGQKVVVNSFDLTVSLC